MMRSILRRVFAVVRFVQLEWSAWSNEQHASGVLAEEKHVEVLLDPYEARILAVEAEIRERCTRNSYTGEPNLTDQQIRNAALAFIDGRDKKTAENSR